MRRALLQFSIYLFFVFVALSAQAQSVGISSNGAPPDNSAMLDVSSGSKGVLIPQVSLSSLTTGTPITNPAPSLLIYNINTNIPGGVGYYYNAGTSANPSWVKLITSINTGAITNTGTITNNGDIIAYTGTVKSVNGTSKVALEKFPMGEISMTGNTTATTTGSAGTYTKVLGNALPSANNNHNYKFDEGGIDPSTNKPFTNRLRYTGSAHKAFHIACTLSINNTSKSELVIKAVISKNGVALTNGVVQTKLAATSGSITPDYTSTAIHVMTDLQQNDYIELHITATTANATFTVTDMNLFAMGISMGMDFE